MLLYDQCVNNLSYAYIELRHYSDAISCLDEAISIAEEKVPDLFFRRSQARTYNKFSNDEELLKALDDIDKAIKLKDEILYKEHKDIINKIRNENIIEKNDKVNKIMSKVKRSYQKIKERKINVEEIIFTKNRDALQQFRILKEMKSKYNLAVKFFTESKNEEQLELTYKEIDSFMKNYETFKFYIKFNTNEINSNSLSEEEKLIFYKFLGKC